jgi:rare lipoprotein A
MANGCPFHAERLSAASRTLPIGSWVRVRRGKRSVVVEITDRGPYVPGRIIDMSRAAAEALDMVAAGVVMVSIEPLSVRLPVGCRSLSIQPQ